MTFQLRLLLLQLLLFSSIITNSSSSSSKVKGIAIEGLHLHRSLVSTLHYLRRPRVLLSCSAVRMYLMNHNPCQLRQPAVPRDRSTRMGERRVILVPIRVIRNHLLLASNRIHYLLTAERGINNNNRLQDINPSTIQDSQVVRTNSSNSNNKVSRLQVTMEEEENNNKLKDHGTPSIS